MQGLRLQPPVTVDELRTFLDVKFEGQHMDVQVCALHIYSTVFFITKIVQNVQVRALHAYSTVFFITKIVQNVSKK